jgi:hypothetical protein
MGKDCVPKVDGYWILKQKTFEKCGAFGPEFDPANVREDACCVKKDCFVFCVEQCYRFVIAFYIPKREDDPLQVLRPFIDVIEKQYDECGNFKSFVLNMVGANANSTYKFYATDYKKECVKCAKYTLIQPLGNFEWFQPRAGTGGTGTIPCDKCEDEDLPQAVAHGSAKRLRQGEVCKALRDCECLDLTAFTHAIQDYPVCTYC